MALRIPHLWGFLRLLVEILVVLAIAVLLVSGLIVAEREIKQFSCKADVVTYAGTLYNSISFWDATVEIPIWKTNFCNVTSFINTYVEQPLSTYVDTSTPEIAVAISGATLVGLIALQLLRYLWMLFCGGFRAVKWLVFTRRRRHHKPAETRRQRIGGEDTKVSLQPSDNDPVDQQSDVDEVHTADGIQWEEQPFQTIHMEPITEGPELQISQDPSRDEDQTAQTITSESINEDQVSQDFSAETVNDEQSIQVSQIETMENEQSIRSISTHEISREPTVQTSGADLSMHEQSTHASVDEVKVGEQHLIQSTSDGETDQSQIKEETSDADISDHVEQEEDAPNLSTEKQGDGRSHGEIEVTVIAEGEGSQKIDVKSDQDDTVMQSAVEQQQASLTDNQIRPSWESTRLFLTGPASEVKKFLCDKRRIRNLAKECQSNVAGHELTTPSVISDVQPQNPDVPLTMVSEEQNSQARMDIACVEQVGNGNSIKTDAPQKLAELAKESLREIELNTSTGIDSTNESANIPQDVATKISVMHDFATNDLRMSIANYHHKLRDKPNGIIAVQAQTAVDQSSPDLAHPMSCSDSEIALQSDAVIVDFEQIQNGSDFAKRKEHLNLTAKQGLVAEIPHNEQRKMISGMLIQNKPGEQTEPKKSVTPLDNNLTQLQLEQEDLSSKPVDGEMGNEKELKKPPAHSQEAESIIRTSDSQGRDSSYDAERVTHSLSHPVINTVDDLAEIILLLTNELEIGNLTRADFAKKMSLMHDDIKKKDFSMRELQTALVHHQHRLSGKKHANRQIKAQVSEDQSSKKVVNQTLVSASLSTPVLHADKRVEYEHGQSGAAEFAKPKEHSTLAVKHDIAAEIPGNERTKLISGTLIDNGGGEMTDPNKRGTSLVNNLKQLPPEQQDVRNKIRDWEMWNERALSKAPAQSVASGSFMSNGQGSDTSYEVEPMSTDISSQTDTLSEHSQQPPIHNQKASSSKDVAAMDLDIAPAVRKTDDRGILPVAPRDETHISCRELTSGVTNVAASYDVLKDRGKSELRRSDKSNEIMDTTSLSFSDATTTYDVLKDRGKPQTPPFDGIQRVFVKAAAREYDAIIGPCETLRSRERTHSSLTEDIDKLSRKTSPNSRDATATYDVLKDRGKCEPPLYEEIDGAPEIVSIPSSDGFKYERRSQSSSPNRFSRKRSYMAKTKALQDIRDSPVDATLSNDSMQQPCYTSNIAYEINMICTGGKGLSPPSGSRHTRADPYYIYGASAINDKSVACRSISDDNVTHSVSDRARLTTTKHHGPVRSQSQPVVDRSQRHPTVNKSQPRPVVDSLQPQPVIKRSQPNPLVDKSQVQTVVDTNAVTSTKPDMPTHGTVKSRILSFQTVSDNGSCPIRSVSPHRMHTPETSLTKGSDIPSCGSLRKKVNALKTISEVQQVAKPELLPIAEMKTSFAKALASFTCGDRSESVSIVASKESRQICDQYTRACGTLPPANGKSSYIESSQIPSTKSMMKRSLRQRRNPNNKVTSVVKMLESQHPMASSNTDQPVYTMNHDAITNHSCIADRMETGSTTSSTGVENCGRSYLSHLEKTKELLEQTATTTYTNSLNRVEISQTTTESSNSYPHQSHHAMVSVDGTNGYLRQIPQIPICTVPSRERHRVENSPIGEIETATFRPISRGVDSTSSSSVESSVSKQAFSDMDVEIITEAPVCNYPKDVPLSKTPERDKYDTNTLVKPSRELVKDGLRHPSCEKEFGIITTTPRNDAEGKEEVFGYHIDNPIVLQNQMLNSELEEEHSSLETPISMKNEDSETTKIQPSDMNRDYPCQEKSVIENGIGAAVPRPVYMARHVRSPFREEMTTSVTSCDAPEEKVPLFSQRKSYFDEKIKSTMRPQSPVSMFIASVTARKQHQGVDSAYIDRKRKSVDGIPQVTRAMKPHRSSSSSSDIVKSPNHLLSNVTGSRNITTNIAPERRQVTTEIAEVRDQEQTAYQKRIQTFSNNPGAGKIHECLVEGDIDKHGNPGRYSPSQNAMACANYTLRRSGINSDTRTSLMDIFNKNLSNTVPNTSPMLSSSPHDISGSVKDRVLSIEKEDYMAFTAAARAARAMPTDEEEPRNQLKRTSSQSREIIMELNCLRHAKQVRHVSGDILMKKMHISTIHENRACKSDQQQNDVADELDQLRNRIKISYRTDNKPRGYHDEPPDKEDDNVQAEDNGCLGSSTTDHDDETHRRDTRTIIKYLSGMSDYNSNTDDPTEDEEVIVMNEHDEPPDGSGTDCLATNDPECVVDYDQAAIQQKDLIIEDVQLQAEYNQNDSCCEDLGISNHEPSVLNNEGDQSGVITRDSKLVDDNHSCVSMSDDQCSIPKKQSDITDEEYLPDNKDTVPNEPQGIDYEERPAESDGGDVSNDDQSIERPSESDECAVSNDDQSIERPSEFDEGDVSNDDQFIVGDEHDPWIILKEPSNIDNDSTQYMEDTRDAGTFSDIPSTRDAGLFN